MGGRGADLIKQIHDKANPHVHIGYFHDEKGTRLKLSRREKIVYNKIRKYMNNLTETELKEIFK